MQNIYFVVFWNMEYQTVIIKKKLWDKYSIKVKNSMGGTACVGYVYFVKRGNLGE